MDRWDIEDCLSSVGAHLSDAEIVVAKFRLRQDASAADVILFTDIRQRINDLRRVVGKHYAANDAAESAAMERAATSDIPPQDA